MKTSKMQSKNFKDLSKRKLIKDYINENKFVPNYRYLEEYSNDEKDLLSFGEEELKYRFQESSKSKYLNFEDRALEELALEKRMQEDIIEKNSLVKKNSLSTLKKLKAELLSLEKELNEKLLDQDVYDEFSFVFVENFNNSNMIDTAKTLEGCEIKESFISLKETSNTKIKIDNLIESYSATGYVREGSLVSSYSLNDLNASLKSEDRYQHIVLSNSNKSDYYLEIDLNFKNKISIDYFNINFSKNSTGVYICKIYYLDESGEYKLTSDKEKQVFEGENLFEINNSNVKKIKIIASCSENNLRRGDNWGFLFSLGAFEICKKKYLPKGTYYSKEISVIDREENPIDFSFARIKEAGCSTLYEGTSVSFAGSKDGVNWITANEDGKINFDKNYDGTERVLEDPLKNDVVLLNNGLAKTNAYIKENENLTKIYRGVGSYNESDGNKIFFVKVEAGTLRFEDSVIINGVEYIEGLSLNAGVYEVSLSSDLEDLYEEIKENFLTWKTTALKTNNKYIEDLNSFYVESNQAYFLVDPALQEHEELLFENSLISSNNKLFIKATLSTNDTAFTPIIDDIRVRVI